MKLRKQTIQLLVVSILIASLLVGCAGGDDQPVQSPQVTPQSAVSGDIYEQMAADAQNPITMTITLPSDNPPDEDASILAEFAKRTGITFEINAIPGDPHEKLGMMLASNDLTDIMIIPNDQMLNQYKQSTHILDQLPYLQENAPSVHDFLTSDVNLDMLKYFTEPDGRVLYLTNDADLLRTADEEFENPNKDADYFWMPWSTSLYVLYPEIDEIAGHKINSLDEWYQAMVAYQEKYPQNYATTMCNEYGEWMLYSLAQIYGHKVQTIAGANFITQDDETYQSLARMPEMLEGLKFLNKLYKEGLMDPEGPIQNKDALVEKMSAGRVFSFLGWFEKIYDANDALGSNESTSTSMFVPQSVMAPGVTQRWEYNMAYIGYNCMMVTDSCPDPSRYFRFLEYLYTDEGLTLNGWGIEGEDYIIDDAGLLGMSDEIKAKFDSDETLAERTGKGFFQQVISLPYHQSDGQFSNVYKSPVYQEEEGMTAAMKVVGESDYNYFRDFVGNYWSDPSTLNIMLPADSEVALTVAKMRTPLNDMVCKAIVADSDAEIEELYNDAMAQFELDGLSELEQFVQNAIDERRK